MFQRLVVKCCQQLSRCYSGRQIQLPDLSADTRESSAVQRVTVNCLTGDSCGRLVPLPSHMVPSDENRYSSSLADTNLKNKEKMHNIYDNEINGRNVQYSCMPHMAINVLSIILRHDDSQTTQISHRVT